VAIYVDTAIVGIIGWIGWIVWRSDTWRTYLIKKELRDYRGVWLGL
jgi:uncharacterized protein YbcC (UPF0753/DUF2309 family)